jgi:hypothetical protein
LLSIRVPIALAVLCTAVLAGCGASTPTGSEQPTVRADAPSKSAAARSPRAAVDAALLEQRSLGEGWRARPTVRPIACPAIDPWRNARFKRYSPLLQFTDKVVTQQTIAVLPSAAAANHASRDLASAPAQACFERALYAEINRRKGLRNFSPMVVLREDPDGQRSTITSAMEYGEVPMYIDEIRTRAGRLLADTVVIAGPRPVDEQVYERLVSLVARRLRVAATAFRSDSGSDGTA